MRPFSLDDVREPEKLYRLLQDATRELESTKRYAQTLADRILTTRELSDADIALVSRELQHGGSHPINAALLLGILSQSQRGFAVLASSSAALPDPSLYEIGTLGIVTSSPIELRYVMDGAPRVWSSPAALTGPFSSTIYAKLGSGTAPTWTASLVDLVLWLTGNPAAANFYRDNAGGANLAASDLVSLINTYGMTGGSYNLLSYILTYYTGNGTTDKAAMYFATGDGSSIQVRFGLDDAGQHILYGPNGSQIASGWKTESTTLSGPTTDTTANLIPANCVLRGVVCRITTTVTGCVSVSVGDATTALRFGSLGTLTAGGGGFLINHMKGGVATDPAGPTQFTADKIRYTAVGGGASFTAGVVETVVFYDQYTLPTS